MTEMKRYRLGNQPEEYELSEDHVGWTPVGYGTWENVFYEEDRINRRRLPMMCELADASNVQGVSLILHQWLSIDAFPLNFYGEERSEKWHRFIIVSYESDPSALFIIPMH